MALPPPPSLHKRKKAAEAERIKLAKQLRLVLFGALAAGALGGVLATWDMFVAPPEKTIHVYRTHECDCVAAWARSLKAEGLVVREHEYETLGHVRASLRMPEELKGCHVAQYLGYFVEGHVPAAALHWLEDKHPIGRGIAASVSGKAQVLHASGLPAERNTLLFYDESNVARAVSSDAAR